MTMIKYGILILLLIISNICIAQVSPDVTISDLRDSDNLINEELQNQTSSYDPNDFSIDIEEEMD